MSTIAVTVYDVIAALRGRGCSMREVVESLPDIDREPVSSAVHRLSERVRCAFITNSRQGSSTTSRLARRGRLMAGAGHVSSG
jgi:hypothetical protein